MNIYSINKPGVPRGLGSCMPDMGALGVCVASSKARSRLDLHLHGLMSLLINSEIGLTVLWSDRAESWAQLEWNINPEDLPCVKAVPLHTGLLGPPAGYLRHLSKASSDLIQNWYTVGAQAVLDLVEKNKECLVFLSSPFQPCGTKAI